MNCHFHQDMMAVSTCSQCLKDICQECLTYTDDGKPICKYCAREIESSGRQNENVSYVTMQGNKSILWLFLLSFLPGLNYMYIGLVKRGLFFIATFLMATYITIETWSIASLLAMFVIFATSLIDGFVKNGKMLIGLPVKDDISDIITFLKKHKAFFVPVVILIIILSIIQQMIFFTFRVAFNLLGFLLELFSGIISLLINILTGIINLLTSFLTVFAFSNIFSLLFVAVGCVYLFKCLKK